MISTDPPARTNVPIDTVIELHVSKGNMFVMPNLAGQVWTDAEPLLRSKGWTGSLVKGPDLPAGDANRAKVVVQAPPAGAGVLMNQDITLQFGQ